ncbi:2-C-methyl-D-erythritol 4-phosphate cytidylyltransferase [Oscillospiraceae bacterium MB08-C2-2]|nr:2-C-methyl-D-erythritol 4-phosphate cytidylyltransferase [Oscillospiraceae bacterium MB08-C2-2]
MLSFLKKEKPPIVTAIIVSAGSSSRMQGVDKQWLELDGEPVLSRSIAAFQACEPVTRIVVVTREDAVPDVYAMVQDCGFNKVFSVVSGGETRQKSVKNGVEAAGGDTAYFAIHDGARPLVEQETILACLEKAMECGGAAAGVPVKDTIKVCGPDGRVLSTPQRSGLYAVQTPQIFEAALFRHAIFMADAAGHTFTDDCQLVEQSGKQVYITPGSYSNLKITTPEDVAVAEAILFAQREGIPGWRI